MKTLFNYKKAPLLAVCLSVLLFAGCNNDKSREFAVITDGECYAFRVNTWISDDCFSDKLAAEREMMAFKTHLEKEDAHNARNWRDAKGK